MVGEESPDKNEFLQNTDRIAWHPAFRSAIKLEFEEYQDALEFKFETELNDEPLKVDAVIIKKLKDVVIRKNIAAIFRLDNIFEFKSPGDFFSVHDFYKVYGYACFYLYLNKIRVTDVTITIVETRHPRELFTHLKEVRGYQVEEVWPGIYHIKGDIIPIQVIESKRLAIGEDLWLRALGNKLDKAGALEVIGKAALRKDDADIRSYLYVIMRSNPGIIQEVLKMSDVADITFEEALEQAGFIARWEARGEEAKALKIVKNLLASGFSVEQAAQLAELDIEKVKTLAG
ncbi:MAG: hypothetical protein LBC62_08395 [Treponema sp.]|jgi:hypothetical protein|nr:hypothetical protein [Treponema sp.]